MGEMMWHRRETRRQTEKTKPSLKPRYWQQRVGESLPESEGR